MDRGVLGVFGEVFGTLALGTYPERKVCAPCISSGGWGGMEGRGVVRKEWRSLEGLSCSTGDACSIKANKTGIIYHYKCLHINCPEAYIGESGRALGDRVKEHLKVPSPIHQHSATTGHPLDPEHFNIVHKEVNSYSRSIKECMFIHIHDPTLNRNLGKYQLLHIWDHLLQASPVLQLKPSRLLHSFLTTPLPSIPPHPPLLMQGGTNFSFWVST